MLNRRTQSSHEATDAANGNLTPLPAPPRVPQTNGPQSSFPFTLLYYLLIPLNVLFTLLQRLFPPSLTGLGNTSTSVTPPSFPLPESIVNTGVISVVSYLQTLRTCNPTDGSVPKLTLVVLTSPIHPMHNALMTELGRLSTIDLSYLVIWVGDVTTSPCARLLSEKFGFATGVVLISGVNSQGERVNFAGNTMPPTAAIKLPSEGAKTLTLLPLYEQGQPVAALPFVQTPVPQLNAIVPGLLNNLMGRLFQAQATVQTITADRELRNNQDREFEESAAADAALAVARDDARAAVERAQEEERDERERREQRVRESAESAAREREEKRGKVLADYGGAGKLAFRIVLPSGKKVMRSFPPDSVVEDLRNFLDMYLHDLDEGTADASIKNYGVTLSYPKKPVTTGPLSDICKGGAVVMINDLDA